MKTSGLFDDGKVDFLGVDLVMKYKGQLLIIGNFQHKIYCSIKTGQNLERGLLEWKLEIFNEGPDKYNPYGWLRTNLPFWETRSRFIELIIGDENFRNLITGFLNDMKRAIGKLPPRIM